MMHRHGLWLIALLSLFILTFAQAQDLMNDAEQSYLAGDYEEAVAHYQGLLAEGIDGGSVHYNLGNTYYQLGQRGRALVHYRRAETTLPRQSDLQRQIMRVERSRQGGIQVERNWLIVLHDLSAEYLTVFELGWIALLSWSGFFGLLAFGIGKRTWQLTLLITGSLMLIIVGIFVIRLYVNDHLPLAVVTADEITTRSGPGTQYLTIDSLYEANEVRILESRESWVRIVLPDQRQGWVQEADVVRIDLLDAK
ncbi:MAG: hypothetical protein ACFE0Q_17305 [Anaerolineae bacterium]